MKSKTTYFCTACGAETPKWQGKCSACGAWNTITEFTEPKGGGVGKSSGVYSRPKRLQELDGSDELRFGTGMGELDRVLGGGAVRGSLVLVGGAPGIGKSTLLLQICSELCKAQAVLYVSGEESEKQLKMRADRLGVRAENLLIYSETHLDNILSAVSDVKPDVLIIDSIQTLYSSEGDSAPGSLAQVKACTMSLLQLSKSTGITVFVVGHVNKEGAIAGPKVLEHMVDCVLYFEGDKSGAYRLLRAAKNRFGSTNEIGVFEMADCGLVEIPNPSAALLKGRPIGASGTCVACPMEGTRPVLAEVQALVTRTTLNVPRRAADGFDYNRAVLLLAVLEKRGGMNLSGSDVYLNVIGGLRLDEPAADLPVALAIASSFRDCPLSDQLAAVGEIGLTGEIRYASDLPKRLTEIARLGFKTCIIPQRGTDQIEAPTGLTLLRVKTL
ncbi:MAG: DNA repair protein RadA, partial [Oscillospiraceae bacterium]|nr:DNA repair protein RadA [Oscillospiraceae bacterium]